MMNCINPIVTHLQSTSVNSNTEGTQNMFKLSKVVVKTVVHVFCIFSSLDDNMVHFYRVYNRMRQLHVFFYDLILYCSVAVKFKKMSKLVCWLNKQIISNKYLKMFVKL